LRLLFIAPFIFFTILDFFWLHGASRRRFAIFLRYSVQYIHYYVFLGVVRSFFWFFGFSELRAIGIDRFSVLFAGLPALLMPQRLGALSTETLNEVLSASDRAGRDEHRRASLPAPAGFVETRRRWLIEWNVILALAHRLRLGCPSRARPGRGSDNEATGFSADFHFRAKLGLIQQQFGHADPARIADAYDAGLAGHVITV
jgi:hypothetical protein